MNEVALSDYQEEMGRWFDHNFPQETPEIAMLSFVEEVGEACRALAKRAQGIRGTREAWNEELENELGDAFISIVRVCHAEGLDLESIVAVRWSTIKERDYQKDKIQHGIRAKG